MASYELRLTIEAWKELVAIPFPFRRQINQRLAKLKIVPRPSGVEVFEDEKHVLVVYGWAILYTIDDVARRITVVSFQAEP
jgi:hypothetical protein